MKTTINQPPEIVFVLPSFSGGGAERVSMNLLRGLALKGKSVALVVFDSSGPLIAMVPDNIEVVDLGTKRLRASVVALFSSLHRLNPRIVFSTHGYVNLSLLFFRFLLPGDCRLWLREANLPSLSLPSHPWPKFMMFGYRLLYKKADLLISTSRRMFREMTELCRVPEAKQIILPNPVDVDSILDRARDVPDLKRHSGPVFIAAGRFTHQKGFDRLIQYIAAPVFSESLLIFLGTGTLRNEFESLVEKMGLQDRIIFAGFQENPWSYLCLADAFLLPSRWEGMPNIVLESLVCGTPVIATPESGGIEDLAETVSAEYLRIVHAGPDFLSAMEQVVKKKNRSCQNVLPEIYHLDKVVARFAGLMEADRAA